MTASIDTTPWRCDGAGWVRGDTGIHLAGPNDHSPRHPATRYDQTCGWCWLGYPHTTDAHESEVKGKSR